MIRYTLNCKTGHEFESWFQNSDASERQLDRGLVACPTCGSSEVSKAIMAPAIRTSKQTRKADPVPERQPVALLSEKEQETRKLLKALREHLTQNAENVGDRFPILARQMHHEEIDSHSIYGSAKPDELRTLLEEGVEVQPLPVLPEDRN